MKNLAEGKQLKSSSLKVYCSKFPSFPTKFLLCNSQPTTTSLPEYGCREVKPGGWKSMPFILGNETLERLANIGLVSNFMVFLMTQFHLDQVTASNVLSIWGGVTNFSPLVGAYISDAYIGRFKTIAFASIAAFTGMVTLTLVAWLPQLHPPHCQPSESHQCVGPTQSQFAVLAVALGCLSIGSGGIRPCSIPFGVDQFDASTDEGRMGINSFFNWYYTTFTLVLILAFTVVVYIQQVNWALGLGIPAALMLIAIALFFIGRRFYVYVTPEGSVFSGIAKVVVASYKKRKVEFPVDEVYYDPPLNRAVAKKLPLTNQFRFLNKAALVTDAEVVTDVDPWRLCPLQIVEETKCILKIMPIWASGIICFTAVVQQGTFTLSQAQKMNRHMGPHFQIPAGTVGVISLITVGIWLPIYDRILVPFLRKLTGFEGGITLLQRMGIGLIFSILSMVAAGLMEVFRRSHADDPVTVFCLAPQLILMGFAEAFNFLGQIEFYNKEFPQNMTSVANSLFSCTMAGASYLSVAVVNVVHRTTGGHGRPDWLTKDINQGRLENLYFLIAGLGVMNLGYFLWVARGYEYKSRVLVQEEEEKGLDVEMNGVGKSKYQKEIIH